MGAPFSDISIYFPTSRRVGTPEYKEEIATVNYICDLYVQHMGGYKPPKTTRITLQPSFYNIWDRTWKIGSIVAIAPYFSYDEFIQLDKTEKYRYILELIQTSVTQLAREYQWDIHVFESAYRKILDCNFNFRMEYPPKKSKDRKKSGWLVVEKTETVSTAYVYIQTGDQLVSKKLFDKKNWWCYDRIYDLAKYCKWIDGEMFGISYEKWNIQILYSVDKDEVLFYRSGKQVPPINFEDYYYVYNLKPM